MLVVALAACGGGGDQAAPTPTPTPGPPAASVPPLRDAAATAGKWVGAAIQSGFLASEPDYAATLKRHFNYLTAEYQMKWDPIQRQQGVFDFSGGDAIVGFAEANGMRVKGHALVWHGATPSWVGTLSPRDLGDAVDDHIRTVAGHYRGHVAAWDVVNEAVAEDGEDWRGDNEVLAHLANHSINCAIFGVDRIPQILITDPHEHLDRKWRRIFRKPD